MTSSSSNATAANGTVAGLLPEGADLLDLWDLIPRVHIENTFGAVLLGTFLGLTSVPHLAISDAASLTPSSFLQALWAEHAPVLSVFPTVPLRSGAVQMGGMSAILSIMEAPNS